MISFVLCDDNSRHNLTLLTHLEHLIPKLPVQAEVALATTEPKDVVDYAQGEHQQTIYLLDLVLEQEQSGLDVCQAIHAVDQEALIIYVSAYAEYALDCLQSHAFDFVLKPYTPERLENAILDAVRFLAFRREAVVLQVTAGSVIRTLDQKAIRYIRSQREYVTAYLTDGELTWRESLTRLTERLKPEWFMHVHKSYVLNRLYFESVNTATREITLLDGTILPISRRKLRALAGTGFVDEKKG